MGGKTKTLTTQLGRVCTCCGVKKIWKDFSIDKSTKIGYTSKCKECLNKYKQEYRKREGIKEYEIEYKRIYRKENELKTKLDNLYYPATRKNRLIIGKRNKKEALKTKIEYLHFTLGYNMNELKKIYNCKFNVYSL